MFLDMVDIYATVTCKYKPKLIPMPKYYKAKEDLELTNKLQGVGT